MKRMKLRYAGTCHLCSADLPARREAYYLADLKKVQCITCPASPSAVSDRETEVQSTIVDTVESPTPDQEPASYVFGEAGAAARLEHSKRKAREEQRYLEAHPRIGRFMLNFREESQQTKAWATGAVGEEKLAKILDSVASPNVAILHDRQIPGSRANIDHMAVTPHGVWVIDAKRYKGRPEKRTKGGLFSTKTEELWVNNRNQTKLIDGLHKQMALVEDALGSTVPVHGALCFVDADWPLIGGDFSLRGIHVLWPKRMRKLLAESGSSGQLPSEELVKLLEVFKNYT